ncbi:MAG: beta-galactosidase GalB [candidate division WOR-3 bacterium]
MKKIRSYLRVIIYTLILSSLCNSTPFKIRRIENFCKDWKFYLGEIEGAEKTDFDDSNWRVLDLPHDWSIEGVFSKDHPTTPAGGALPGGIGWYRKRFVISEKEKDKLIFIDFLGIYQNSEVWINGHYLGKRPYGYISFRYELTPYLNLGGENVIAVRVNNSQQPNSRWYSGSGIYRNVWLVYTNKIFVDNWGTFITTPKITKNIAEINIKTDIRKRIEGPQEITLKTLIYDEKGRRIANTSSLIILKDSITSTTQKIKIKNPILWSIENPYLYKAISQIEYERKIFDDYETSFGIRYFNFDPEKGFFLNGKHIKIKGVCNHHDLGCLGSAVNLRALERQLEILKGMGCNAIRTSHNPPTPELLDLCDKMGFIVMDEAFDVWEKKKMEFDYHLYFKEWHKKDLEDMIRRDRNHPSVFIWSIGNEVMEQWDKEDSVGSIITKELVKIVKNVDPTRPVTAACNETQPSNPIIKSGALDLIGYNYSHDKFVDFPKTYPGKILIATETNSSLATRGHYDMPSDSIRIWPPRWDLPLSTGNPDYTCSSYDNCRTPWGSTHEETWKIVKKYDFISGMFIWSGFDYLGEPTPYGWPARSSYFGVIDLAGFPKDAYYFYKSEWSDEPVLHLLPHWNWKEEDIIDVWVYTNYDEVELFLNGESLGKKQKNENDYKLVWRVNYIPGTLKAIGKKKGEKPIVKEVKTAGKPSKIILEPDRKKIKADGKDLSFIIVKVVDEKGVLVPYASNLINFEIKGEGSIIGVDNGSQISHEPFKANYIKAFNGLCLVVVQAKDRPGRVSLLATSEGLKPDSVEILAK